MQEITQYLSQYTGIGKAFRAYALSKKTQHKQIKGELIALAFQICKEENLPGYYELITKETKLQVQQSDSQWYQQEMQNLQQQVQQKNQDIQLYKQQKNNQSTRLSIIELAKIQLSFGQVHESSKSFERSATYASQGDSIIEYIDDYSQSLLFNCDYEKLNALQIQLHGLQPNQIELKEKLSIGYACQLLRTLATNEYQDFMEIAKNKLQPDDFPDNINHITTMQDLGNYSVIIGFFKNRKLKQKREFTHFHVLYNNENVSPLIVSSQNAQIAADNYLQMQYPVVLKSLKQILDQEHKYDPFLQEKQAYLQIIEKNFLIDYLKPFNQIKIEKIANEFGYDKQALIANLEQMISDQSKGKEQLLNFLIDPIEECLVQKNNEESKKVDTYNKAMKSITKYLQDKQKTLLHYRLQQISKDNNKEFNMEDFGDEMAIQQGINFR